MTAFVPLLLRLLHFLWWTNFTLGPISKSRWWRGWRDEGDGDNLSDHLHCPPCHHISSYPWCQEGSCQDKSIFRLILIFVGKSLPHQAMDRFDLHQPFLLSDPNNRILLLATYQLSHLWHLWHQNDNKASRWHQRQRSLFVFLCLYWLCSHLCGHRMLPLERRLVFQVLWYALKVHSLSINYDQLGKEWHVGTLWVASKVAFLVFLQQKCYFRVFLPPLFACVCCSFSPR